MPATPTPTGDPTATPTDNPTATPTNDVLDELAFTGSSTGPVSAAGIIVLLSGLGLMFLHVVTFPCR